MAPSEHHANRYSVRATRARMLPITTKLCHNTHMKLTSNDYQRLRGERIETVDVLASFDDDDEEQLEMFDENDGFATSEEDRGVLKLRNEGE